jgi:hypothetical protein
MKFVFYTVNHKANSPGNLSVCSMSLSEVDKPVTNCHSISSLQKFFSYRTEVTNSTIFSRYDKLSYRISVLSVNNLFIIDISTCQTSHNISLVNFAL